MLISKSALTQIEYLCAQIPDVEWSGILSYKVNGSITNPEECLITVIDVYPMNIGSAAYTEYEYTTEWACYMANHPELLEENVFQGHIHSHNKMGTYFSGTDTGELQDSAPLYNQFVSLIVNNAGAYTGAVASVVEQEGEKTIINKVKDFDGTVNTITNTVPILEKRVVYIMADIIKEGRELAEEFTNVVITLKEEAKKAQKAKSVPISTFVGKDYSSGPDSYYSDSVIIRPRELISAAQRSDSGKCFSSNNRSSKKRNRG